MSECKSKVYHRCFVILETQQYIVVFVRSCQDFTSNKLFYVLTLWSCEVVRLFSLCCRICTINQGSFICAELMNFATVCRESWLIFCHTSHLHLSPSLTCIINCWVIPSLSPSPSFIINWWVWFSGLCRIFEAKLLCAVTFVNRKQSAQARGINQI